MYISEWLVENTKKLEQAGVLSARLDCLVLLEDATGKDRAYLLAHDDQKLSDKTAKRLDPLIERRATHEPLAYIRGKAEFYGREFAVNKHTLTPRPETEAMIDILKTWIPDRVQNDTAVITDIGTGSGCLAITTKLEFPNFQVLATDVSKPALSVAKKNADDLVADVDFLEANLLQGINETAAWIPDRVRNGKTLVIVANLPYVPNDYEINQAATHEPGLALFGGVDGLDLYRELFKQIETMERKPQYILTESLIFQHHPLASLARKHGYVLEETKDLIQLFALS